MKKIYTITSLLSLFAFSAFSADLESIVASDAGGKWSEASTWTTPDNAVPASSSSSSYYTSLTVGTGKLVVDKENVYVKKLIASASGSEIEIASDKTFTWRQNGANEDGSYILNGSAITFSGDGTLNLNTQNWYKGSITINAKTNASGGLILKPASQLTINEEFNGAGKFEITVGGNSENNKININANTSIRVLNSHSQGLTTVAKDATLTVTRFIYMNNPAQVVVNGALDITTDNTNWKPYAYIGTASLMIGTLNNDISTAPTFTLNAGATANVGNVGSNICSIANAATINVAGSLNAKTFARLYNKSVLNMQGGTFSADKIVIANYKTTVTRPDNMSAEVWTNSTADTTVTINVTDTSKILSTIAFDDDTVADVNAKNSYLNIDFSGLADGETLTISNITGLTSVGANSNRIVVLNNYKDGALIVSSQLEKDGEYVKGIYGDVAGTIKYYQLADGSISAIPEPSTYAMIFGAIALGFVAYRRRK